MRGRFRNCCWPRLRHGIHLAHTGSNSILGGDKTPIELANSLYPEGAPRATTDCHMSNWLFVKLAYLSGRGVRNLSGGRVALLADSNR